VTWARSLVLVVVGIVIGMFAVIGRSRRNDRTMAAGVVLVVLAVVGWFGLGFAGGVLELLAALFALIAGVLYLLAAR
jgi:chromate transport protein ChrA